MNPRYLSAPAPGLNRYLTKTFNENTRPETTLYVDLKKPQTPQTANEDISSPRENGRVNGSKLDTNASPTGRRESNTGTVADGTGAPTSTFNSITVMRVKESHVQIDDKAGRAVLLKAESSEFLENVDSFAQDGGPRTIFQWM